MHEQDFLEFGLWLNKAEESVRLNSYSLINNEMDTLITQLQAMPDDEDRAYLLDAAGRKRQARYVLYPQEAKEALQTLARMWCSLHKQKETYTSVLSGMIELDQLPAGHQKTEKFHAALVEFAGGDDKLVLIKALLRIQEAAVQFQQGTHDGKDRPASKWTTYGSIKTIWQIPAK